MPQPTPTPLFRPSLGTSLLALVLIGAFYGLQKTEPGIQVYFWGGWTNSNPGELYMWLATAALLFPAGLLLGWHLTLLLERPLLRVVHAAQHLQTPRLRALLLAGFALLTGAAVLGNLTILQGLPFTDDEWSARYGGQLLLTGHLTEPIPPWLQAFPHLFFYLRDGAMTCFDWIGVQLPWAVAELTRTGPLTFSLLAALALVATVAAAARRLSNAWALPAAVLLLTSPMAVTLSITTHGHLTSRAFLAVALLALTCALHKPRALTFAIAGAAAALAAAARPLEVTALLLPLLAALAWDARRDPERRKHLLAFLAAAAVPTAFVVLHSLALTDTPLPARLAGNNELTPGDWYHPPLAFLKDPQLLWQRFGANLAYNLFMLAIWAFGPLTLPLALLGLRTDRTTRLLGAGVALDLLLTLLHDNYGLHTVGPIHYSEAIVPLTLLATHGLHNLHGHLRTRSLPHHRVIATLLLASTLAHTLFLVQHMRGLRRQGRIHADLYAAIDTPEHQGAVLLAPLYGNLWRANPRTRNIGSFVFEWRKPSPRHDDTVTILHDVSNNPRQLQLVRDAFPNRPLLRLIPLNQEPWLRIDPLEDSLKRRRPPFKPRTAP